MENLDLDALNARLDRLGEQLLDIVQLVEDHVITERIRPLEDHLGRNGAVLA